jgi:hypothetical protein
MDFSMPRPSTPAGLVQKRQTREVLGQFLTPENASGSGFGTLSVEALTFTAHEIFPMQSELPRTVTLPWELLGLYVPAVFGSGPHEFAGAKAAFKATADMAFRLKILRNGTPIWIASQEDTRAITGENWVAPNRVFIFSEDFTNPILIGPNDRLSLEAETEVTWTNESPEGEPLIKKIHSIADLEQGTMRYRINGRG